MADSSVKLVISSPSDATYPEDLTLLELLSLLGSTPTPASDIAALSVTGTNQDGNDLTISGGASTGSGTPGRVVFQVSGKGALGSSVNALGDVLTLAGPATAQDLSDGLTITGGAGSVSIDASGASSAVDLSISAKGAGTLTLSADGGIVLGVGSGLVVGDGPALFDVDEAFQVLVDGDGGLAVTSDQVCVGSGVKLGWGSGDTVLTGALDTYCVRSSQGIIETRTTAAGATYSGFVCGQKSASSVGLRVRRFSSGATGNLQTWEDETGASMASVLKNGVVSGEGFTSTALEQASDLGTPGTVVGRIPGYTKTGVFLGWMPIYDVIE